MPNYSIKSNLFFPYRGGGDTDPGLPTTPHPASCWPYPGLYILLLNS